MDPQTLDLVKLESNADEIPPYLPLRSLRFAVTYGREQIGDTRALLAQDGEVQMLSTSGKEDYNQLEFTHCRAYTTQSEMHFDFDSSGPPPAAASAVTGAPNTAARPEKQPAEEPIPALLMVAIRLTTPVTENEAVGTLIEGRTDGAVMNKGRVVVPNGTLVRGRIRRLEHYRDGQHFIVGLEFTEIDLAGGPRPFYADLLRMDRLPGVDAMLSDSVVVLTPAGVEVEPEQITLPELPGVASFFIHGPKFTLPAGFGTVWRTRSILH